MKTFHEQTEFDLCIGRLDRQLSEFLELYDADPNKLDDANKHTLKHHADDLIGVGQRMLKKLGLGTLINEAGTIHHLPAVKQTY